MSTIPPTETAGTDNLFPTPSVLRNRYLTWIVLLVGLLLTIAATLSVK